jgi:hypothetical protein
LLLRTRWRAFIVLKALSGLMKVLGSAVESIWPFIRGASGRAKGWSTT